MPVNYQLGKIYTLINDVNNTIYVGSTAQKVLGSRMSGHRRDALTETSPIYTAMRTIGTDHFRIVLHHAFPCTSKDELVAEEYRTIDTIIASGKSVYNAIIQGKHSAEVKKKIAEANIGKKHTEATKKKMAEAQFSFGSLTLQIRKTRGPEWVFRYYDEAGKYRGNSFSVAKYGNYGALFRAEEARRAVYPEWGNEEDIACDDLGHIEWE